MCDLQILAKCAGEILAEVMKEINQVLYFVAKSIDALKGYESIK